MLTTQHTSAASGAADRDLLPSPHDLEELYVLKHRNPARAGWSVRRRHHLRYYLPEDWYEALVAKLVRPGTRWLDVGGGSSPFPHNAPLARLLADRSALLVGVDPDANVLANPFVHEKVHSPIEEYRTEHTFDLVTFRMVVEHIAEPARVLETVRPLVRPGGRVVIYTVNLWAPLTLGSWLLPFYCHYPIKRLLWGGQEKDTFPVAYKMNTRQRLKALFKQGGFAETLFLYLDDCGTFGHFKRLNWLELHCWRLLRRLGLRYPENCLLGVYRKGN